MNDFIWGIIAAYHGDSIVALMLRENEDNGEGGGFRIALEFPRKEGGLPV